MRWLRLAAALGIFSGPGTSLAAQAPADPALARAERVLAGTILFDGHNDLPWAVRSYKEAPGDLVRYDLRGRTPGQTDLPRLRAGRVGAQFWSVYVPGEGGSGFARMQLEQIELARRIISHYPEALQLALTAADVRAARKRGRIASLLGMEGGHAIEDSLGTLRAYYELGVRYMALTHNTHTNWADAGLQVPARHGGLSAFGVEVVREMNRLGMLIDLSHASPETMHDALDASEAPVIFSHSAAKALTNIPRNVPDDVIARLPKNGGVLMVTFVSGFVSTEAANVQMPAIQEMGARMREAGPNADRSKIYEEVMSRIRMPEVPIGAVADHIEHVVKIAGIDNVGIGSDFDGNSFWPDGLDDVSTFPNLFAELVRRGWSDAHLRKLAGENVLRALEQAERVSERLRQTEPSRAALAQKAAEGSSGALTARR